MRTLAPLLGLVVLLVGCGDEPTIFDDEDGGAPVEEAGFDTSIPDVSDDTPAGEDTFATADTTPADSGAAEVEADAGSDAAPIDAPLDTAVATDGAPVDTGTETGPLDTGMADTGKADTGSADTGSADTGTDTGVKVDGGPDAPVDGGPDAPVVCGTVSCTLDTECAAVGCGKCLGAGKCGN